MSLIIPISLIRPSSQPAQSSSGIYVEPTGDGTVTTGGTARYVGNSITYGFDASPRETARYSALLSAAKGWTEDNQGLSGYPLCPNPCISFIPKSLIPNKTSDLRFLFIAGGANDIQLNPGVTPAFFQSTLEDWVATAVTQGWHPHRVIILSPFYADFTTGSFPPCNTLAIDTQRRLDFLAAAKAAATNSGAFFIDVYTPMQAYPGGGDSLLTPISGGPGIHPTTAGHAFIYSIISAIMQTS